MDKHNDNDNRASRGGAHKPGAGRKPAGGQRRREGDSHGGYSKGPRRSGDRRFSSDDRRGKKRSSSAPHSGKPHRSFNGDHKPRRNFDGDRKPRFNDGPEGRRDGKRDGRLSGRNSERRFEKGGKGFGPRRDGKPGPRSGKSRRDFDGDRKPRRDFDNDRKPRFDKRRDDHKGGYRQDRPGKPGNGFRSGKPRTDRVDVAVKASADANKGGFRGFSSDKQRKPLRRNVRLTPARRLAYQALSEVREEGCYLSVALEHAFAGEDLPEKERAFARLLATEVVCRRGSLDELIDSVLSNPEDIEPEIRDALRISFCELFYLGKAEHAAADQGVELVRSIEPKATRLANFALRHAVEVKGEFPFGDPETDDHALALLHGFPLWLVERLIDELGREAAVRFLARSNEPAPLFFMVNVARANGAETLQGLVAKGMKLAPVKPLFDERGAFPSFVFAHRTAVGAPAVERMIEHGELVISDLAAQSIAQLALPDAKPSRFLEIGAGSGTKSILLQNASLARFGSQMTLDMLDMSSERTSERDARLKRARIDQDASYLKNATDLSDMEGGAYDAVFVDAPCSGVGTLRRHPEIRWRVDEEGIEQLAQTGEAILAQAARLVAPGGRLTYATCTLFARENDQVISSFLESEAGKDFELVSSHTARALAEDEGNAPQPDIHFAAVMVRVS